MHKAFLVLVLFLVGCQVSRYPSYAPVEGARLLDYQLHPDRRQHPFPYSPEEIGLTAGEFTEFMRQRLEGCYSGCDFKPEPEKSYFQTAKRINTLTLDVSGVPEPFQATVKAITDEMRDLAGWPVALAHGEGLPIVFEDTTGAKTGGGFFRSRPYSCLYSPDKAVIIGNQFPDDFQTYCLWEEIGHAFGLGKDTYNFNPVTSYEGTYPQNPRRKMGGFYPAEKAAFWVLYDPRFNPTFDKEWGLHTIYHIAVSELNLTAK